MTSITPKIDQQVPWECYRCPNTNLVYFRHMKCASTLYSMLFYKLKWEKTDTHHIDWNYDKVFSLIRNPLNKHRKGIVEYFYFYYRHGARSQIEIFLKNLDLIQILAQIPYLDVHSMSLYSMLGTNAELVDFIPIDTGINHKRYVLDSIKQYVNIDTEIESWFLLLPKIGELSGKNNELFERLMQEPTPSQILRYIDYDTILYEIAKIKYSYLKNSAE